MEISEQLQPIGSLLEKDQENVANCKRLLVDFDSRLYAAFEHTAITYRDFATVLGADENLFKSAYQEVRNILDTNGIRAEEFTRIARNETEARVTGRAGW